jgi:hypothetical protein
LSEEQVLRYRRFFEADLPVDFDLHRDMRYTAIAQPIDPSEFVTSLRSRLDTHGASMVGFATIPPGAIGSPNTTCAG